MRNGASRAQLRGGCDECQSYRNGAALSMQRSSSERRVHAEVKDAKIPSFRSRSRSERHPGLKIKSPDDIRRLSRRAYCLGCEKSVRPQSPIGPIRRLGCAALDGNAGCPRNGLFDARARASRPPGGWCPRKLWSRGAGRSALWVIRLAAVDAKESPGNGTPLPFVGWPHVVARTAPLSATVLLKKLSFRTTATAAGPRALARVWRPAAARLGTGSKSLVAIESGVAPKGAKMTD